MLKQSLSTSTLLAAAATAALIFAEDPSLPQDSEYGEAGLEAVGITNTCAGASLVEAPFELSEGSRRLALARLSDCERSLEDFLAEQKAICAQESVPAEDWHLLAEAYLERARARTSHKGLRVGEPVLETLPAVMRSEIAAGLAAVESAKKLAAEDADLLRIEAELLSAQITGFGSAIKYSGRISELTRKASILDRSHPRLQVTLGARKLFAPEFLGHDPQAARAHLLAAASALELDERPYLLAAMASHLLGDKQGTSELLAKSAERNPANRFVAAVISRLEAGEADPFGGDLVTAN
ncbi:MAG: hypothetical protein ACYTG5_05605 [Planctomycetota bacterium]